MATLSGLCLRSLFQAKAYHLTNQIVLHWDQVPFAKHASTRHNLTLLIVPMMAPHNNYYNWDSIPAIVDHRTRPPFHLDEHGNVQNHYTNVDYFGTLIITAESAQFMRFLMDMFPHITHLSVAYFDFDLTTLHHTIGLLEQWGPKLESFALYGGFKEYNIPLSNRLLATINAMHSLKELKLIIDGDTVGPNGEQGFDIELPILARLEMCEYEYRNQNYRQFYDSLKRYAEGNLNLAGFYYHERIQLDSEAYDDFLGFSPELAHRFKRIEVSWSSLNQQHLLLPLCIRFCRLKILKLVLVRWPLTFISRADLVGSLCPLRELRLFELEANPECIEYLTHNANQVLVAAKCQHVQCLPQVRIVIIRFESGGQPLQLTTHALVANMQLARLFPNVQVVCLNVTLTRVCAQCRAANQFDTRKCYRLAMKAIFDTCPNLKFIDLTGHYHYREDLQDEDDAPVEGDEDDAENSERNEDEDEHDDNIVNANANNNVLVLVEDDGNNTDVSDDSAIAADDDDVIADDINVDVLVDLLVNNNDQDDDDDGDRVDQPIINP